MILNTLIIIGIITAMGSFYLAAKNENLSAAIAWFCVIMWIINYLTTIL